MSDHNGTMLFLSVIWIGWAVSCKWMGMFNIITALVLASITASVLGVSFGPAQ